MPNVVYENFFLSNEVEAKQFKNRTGDDCKYS